MNILLIILFILLVAETIYFICYTRRKVEIQSEEKEKIYQIQKEINELNQQKTQLLDDIANKKQEVENIYETEKNKLSEQIKTYEKNTSYASEQYVSILEQQYVNIEKEYDKKVKDLEKQEEQSKSIIQKYENQINDLKNTLNAGAQAQQRERELEEKQDFYKLTLTANDLEDITKLEDIKWTLHQPSILSKLIWTTYFQKQTTEMCNRILGTTSKVCGIYKITDLKTKQAYVGQSVN